MSGQISNSRPGTPITCEEASTDDSIYLIWTPISPDELPTAVETGAVPHETAMFGARPSFSTARELRYCDRCSGDDCRSWREVGCRWPCTSVASTKIGTVFGRRQPRCRSARGTCFAYPPDVDSDVFILDGNEVACSRQSKLRPAGALVSVVNACRKDHHHAFIRRTHIPWWRGL
jgi:hypothetical protein